MDGNPRTLRILEEMLLANGMKPLSVETAKEALAALAQWRAEGKPFPLAILITRCREPMDSHWRSVSGHKAKSARRGYSC